MSPTYCSKCERANAAEAKTCIWCGEPLAGSDPQVTPTRVEIEYVKGIDRFEDPGPVHFSISGDSIEIEEQIPGSRSVTIPASSIIEAYVVDASMVIEEQIDSPVWWRRIMKLVTFGSTDRPSRPVSHDYILTIKYQADDGIRTALFNRQDSGGLVVMERLARMVSKMARHERTA